MIGTFNPDFLKPNSIPHNSPPPCLGKTHNQIRKHKHKHIYKISNHRKQLIIITIIITIIIKIMIIMIIIIILYTSNRTNDGVRR
jgi:ABC-type multidrug transport system permease subunit